MISLLVPVPLVHAALMAGLVLQGRTATVGDTVWVRRTVPVPAGHTVRPAEWEPSDPVELLGRPRVVITGDSAEVSYPVVLWQPGLHTIDLPGPLLLGPGGTVDSLSTARVRVEVRSVLPPAPSDSVIAPQPRASLIEGREVSPLPLGLLWLAALTVLIPLHLWWRRRGKVTRPAPAALRPNALEPPLARWADAGEHRALAGVATAQLRTALAERVPSAHPGLDTERVMAELAAARPQWPLEEVGDLLRKLDDVRFGVTASSAALGLSRSTMELRDRLLRDAA
ncbi:MAG TPA: hypothetical protein VFY42_04365 [Gemmatimonadales bacterium]|nr:hypothetical protein [Gemmatimonadales bacterium]